LLSLVAVLVVGRTVLVAVLAVCDAQLQQQAVAVLLNQH
jgi:hypothetical protein